MDRRTVLTGLAVLAAAGCAATARAAVIAKGQLSNSQAIPEAQALYRYLCQVSDSRHTLTGQQTSKWDGETGPELDHIQQVTDQLPAIIGLDFIDPLTCHTQIERAVGWYKDFGGIPTICWHWGNPLVGPGY